VTAGVYLKRIVILIALMALLIFSFAFSEERTLTTIMPGTDTARYERGVVGVDWRAADNSNIGNNNLIVQGNIAIGDQAVTKGRFYIDPTDPLQSDDPTDDFIIDNNGNVGIGTDTPLQGLNLRGLDVSGVTRSDVHLLNPVDLSTNAMKTLTKQEGMLCYDTNDKNLKKWDPAVGNSGEWIPVVPDRGEFRLIKEKKPYDGMFELNMGGDFTNHGHGKFYSIALNEIKAKFPEVAAETEDIYAFLLSFRAKVKFIPGGSIQPANLNFSMESCDPDESRQHVQDWTNTAGYHTRTDWAMGKVTNTNFKTVAGQFLLVDFKGDGNMEIWCRVHSFEGDTIHRFSNDSKLEFCVIGYYVKQRTAQAPQQEEEGEGD